MANYNAFGRFRKKENGSATLATGAQPVRCTQKLAISTTSLQLSQINYIPALQGRIISALLKTYKRTKYP